ncbi:MAG: hypothetical protein VKJ24_08720 [Synechococcales bacterium]|nr:hypothetical protein [Synechococcales bacterium]
MAIRFKLLVTVGFPILCLFPSGKAQAAETSQPFIYQLDTIGSDTTPEDLLPLGVREQDPFYEGSIVGDLMWLNRYQVEAGGEVIQAISLTFGSADPMWAGTTGLSDWQTNPYPISLFLYSDPNQDGDPSDAQILTTTEGTIANPDTMTLNRFAITPTQLAVGSNFFLAALVRNQRREKFPATLDRTTYTPGRSWYVLGDSTDTQPDQFDASTLTNNVLGPTALSDDFRGNWVLRAEATALPRKRVPEGRSPWSVMFAGAIALGGLARRRLVKRGYRRGTSI